MKQKLLGLIRVTVWLHTDELILNGRQNRSSGANSELLRRAGATT